MDSLGMRARLSRERAAAILSYLRHFREGSSVHLKKFQRLLGLMSSASAVCHLGLSHMRPLQLWLKSRVPWTAWTAWTSGRLSIAVTCGCIEALAPWSNPDLFSRGGPPRLGGFTRGGHNRRINARLGSGVRGNASFGTVVGTSDPMANKPLGTGSSLFSSKGVSGTTGTACTDSHRQHVRGFVHKSPGRHSFQGLVQAGSDFTAMGGLSPSLHQSNTHPRSPESRGRHAFEEENPSRKGNGGYTPSRFR